MVLLLHLPLLSIAVSFHSLLSTENSIIANKLVLYVEASIIANKLVLCVEASSLVYTSWQHLHLAVPAWTTEQSFISI